MEGLVAPIFAISAPLTGGTPGVDIPGMLSHSRQNERLPNKGADPLVARAIERWENEGGAVTSPSRPRQLRDPNQFGEFSADMAAGEERPNP